MSSIQKIRKLYLNQSVNIYTYGSVCYGTSHELSDEDFIVVADTHPEVNIKNVEVHQYSKERFFQAIKDHEIWAMECFFLPSNLKHEDFILEFKYSPARLRVECSSKSSNSWVKAKKKIEKEGEIYIGEKSLFHALRILDFGIQIAEHGKIVNYASQNENYQKIVGQNKTWPELKQEFQAFYNALGTRLRILCPLN